MLMLRSIQSLSVLMVFFLAGCAVKPPKNPEDLCQIFMEKRSWHKAAKKMEAKWGTPVNVPMAMMYQESSFIHDAKPPMQYFLGMIPKGRASSAFGYAQAKDETWKDYQKEAGSMWSDRDDFADAIDFMGWYTSKTYQVNNIDPSDAYNQYLNYHEGWTGFKRGSYRQKSWLPPVARKVEARAQRYAKQYQSCQL